MTEVRLAMSKRQIEWINQNIDSVIERQAMRCVESNNQAADADEKLVTILYMLKCGARLV